MAKVVENWIEARELESRDEENEDNWSWIDNSYPPEGSLFSHQSLEGDVISDIDEGDENIFASRGLHDHRRRYNKHKVWIDARNLRITDAENPNHWHWITFSQGEVAKLVGDPVLDIRGCISSTKVRSKYIAYLVFKTEPNHNNIDRAYSKVGGPKVRQVSLARYGRRRPDGWFEIVLGDFSGSTRQLNFQLKGIEDYHPKFGLLVRAVEIREK